MKTILISAYALSPSKGSEFNVGWEFVRRLSIKNRIIVLYGVSGEHMGDTSEVDRFFDNNKSNNIVPIKVCPPMISRAFNILNKKGLNYAFYIAFNFWQREAYKQALKVVDLYDVDIIHQLNPIGFREPGYLWKIPRPHVWGPIGGANYVKLALLKPQPLKAKLTFFIKNIVNYFQINFSRRVKVALSNSDVVVFCNNENKKNLFNKNIQKSMVLSEQSCSNSDFSLRGENNRFRKSKLELVVVGSLFYRKNLKFIIDVLSSLNEEIQLCLNIVGDGHLKDELIQYSITKGVSHLIVWHGNISRDDVMELMKQCDLHCLCSLSEANTTVVYEAFSIGLPTISLKQNGMSDTLADGMGFLVDIENYELTISNYASKVKEIYFNRHLLNCCSDLIFNNIDTLEWDAKINSFNKIYDELLAE
ncbi:glycosyltransferase [Shewanella sp. S1-49-MNA-CIBAN-0167]|uniref:glycosyltransferase n=1 Tax=Shewanella sp. S1-49-MNA-CIBAN-0167 TaxID=3140468 RepID=UPI00332C3137